MDVEHWMRVREQQRRLAAAVGGGDDWPQTLHERLEVAHEKWRLHHKLEAAHECWAAHGAYWGEAE